MHEYDNKVTSKIFGHGSADKYYSVGSCENYFSQIRIPCFLFNALDDPIVPHTITEHVLQGKVSENVSHIITKKGGHVAYLEGLWPSGKTWVDRVGVDVLESLLKAIKKSKMANSGELESL
jgi:abhydrolase domain-containing protein 1/3